MRQWPNADKCDESAAAPYDPGRRSAGARLEEIAGDVALSACSSALRVSRREPRYVYQLGRALVASGTLEQARTEFEQAAARGYPASRIDLARLLTRPTADMRDIRRAISLLRQAWQDGVPIAAYELGRLYEDGVGGFHSDATQAWTWYQRGANAAEPSALARFGGREDEWAFSASDRTSKNAHLLQAFRYYAAAAERARIEDWPDEAWRQWRYRRASLARVLAREGMTEQVAAAYEDVVKRQAPRAAPAWRRLIAYLGSH